MDEDEEVTQARDTEMKQKNSQLLFEIPLIDGLTMDDVIDASVA